MSNLKTIKQQVFLKNLPTFVNQLILTFKKHQVILLVGSLGVGKTTLVCHFLKHYQNKYPTLSAETAFRGSPAFGVFHHYLIDQTNIYHADLYRLKNDDDLETTGFWDLFDKPFKQKEVLIFIEWANYLNLNVLPNYFNYLTINLKFTKASESRLIEVSFDTKFSYD